MHEAVVRLPNQAILAVATFLVDGNVAGIWKYEDGEVRLEPFDRPDRSTLRELRELAERLASFHV